MLETPVEELVAISHTHQHAFSFRALTWWTLAIVALMGLLYFIVGFPPAFDTFYEKMYFHAVGIGLAALASYLVIDVFNLERVEPPLDFPLSYRAFWAVVLGALGGVVYLNVSVSNALPDVGIVLFTLAFLLLADVGGALLIELLLLPRKLAGVYREETHNIVDYIGRVVPLKKADRRAYAAMGAGYWLALTAVTGAFAAGLVGFVNLWLRMFGASFFAGYMGWLGLDTRGFLDATLDPHSHLIALAIMAGIVAVAAVRFGLLESASPTQRTVARVGLWIAVFGTIATTLVLLAVAFLNFAPPTLFVSGPGGANGMAGDDLTMSIIGIGAMVVVVAVLLDRAVWRNGLRLLVMATWVAAMLLNAVSGFYIEMNEDRFGGSLAANDSAYKVAQPMTGIFLLMALSLVLLVVDYYRVEGRQRRIFVWLVGLGLLAAVVGSTLWTFADPSNSGPSFALYVVGTGLSYLAFIVGAWAVSTVPVSKYSRLTP